MNNEQQLIFNYLTQNAQGIANAKTAQQIQAATGIAAGGGTYENIRTLIREMIHTHSCLIGSNNNGYWIINTINETQETINSLQQRADENIRRADALKTTWNNQNPNNPIP